MDPRRSGRESGIFAAVPLHRCTCVVAADQFQIAHHFLRGDETAVDILMIGVDALDVAVVLKAVEVHVRHSDLFTLINVWGTLHHVQAGREHLCGDDAELLGIIAEAGNDTRLVVIVPVQAVPRLALELILPFVQDRAEYGELRLLIGPFSDRSRYAVNMLKLEDHVQLGLLFVCVFFCLFNRDVTGLTDREQVIFGKHAAVHFLQIFMYVRAVADIRGKAAVQSVCDRAVRVGRILGDHADDVHAEAVDPLVAPPGHHIEDSVAHLWILPVQIRLLFGKAVQIVHISRFVILPCGTAKAGTPVVRLLAVDRILPYIIVAVWIILGLAALDEPRVFIGGVIDDEVHHDLQMMLVCLGEHAVKVLHRTELGHDVPVIGDVIAIVVVRGLVNRGEPEYVDTELFQIRQVLRDAVQVADPVSVAVCKAARINLINDGLFPPGLCFISNLHHSYLHSRLLRQPLILLTFCLLQYNSKREKNLPQN